MATLGLPRVRVAFLNAAEAVTKFDTTGTVALVLRDAAISEAVALAYPTLERALADKEWSAANVTAITLAFQGDPRMVRIAALPAAGLMATAYTLLETMKYDICCPVGLTSEEMEAFVTWALTAYETKRTHALYAVTAAATPDDPYLVWFDTDDIETADDVYTAEEFLPRVAGIIAGLPLYQAPTYHVLTDVIDCPHLTRAQGDAATAAGKLILYHDGEKVKLGRGVNSLTTVPGDDGYTDEWKKIKVVRILNRVEGDIIAVTEDNYIGKVPNTYVNKLLLIANINAYLELLEGVDVLVPGLNSVDIDVESQRA
jgi:hypothetical protein